MSLDRSLKSKDTLQRRRNVLTRAERIESLKEDEKFDPTQDSVFGLPKIKPAVVAAPTRPRPGPEPEEGAEAASSESAEQ